MAKHNNTTTSPTMGDDDVLTFFFAALVVTAAVLVALDVVGVVAQLVVLGAPVLGALGPHCGEEETTIIGDDSSKK